MKILTLPSTLLALALSCFAAEPNPFLQPAKDNAPPPPSGDSFVSLTEHILVPADQLDAWLDKHPLKEDASELRSEMQRWIAAGTARLDHTAVSTGTAGRPFTNDSVREQKYTTRYEPPNPGEWPRPTAFNTRNLGYNVSGGAGIEQGAMTLRARMEYTGMILPHHAWSPLAEQTRQPDDIFIPRFRNITVERAKQDSAETATMADPFAMPANSDPYAEPRHSHPFSPPTETPTNTKELRFDPGTIYLASRADEDSTESRTGGDPGLPATSPKLPTSHIVRLIFFRGTLLVPKNPAAVPPVIRHLSAKIIRVDHRTFSDWLQTTHLVNVPDLGWAAASDWQKKGQAEAVATLTGAYHSGSGSVVENLQEVTYSTEWEPGIKARPTDGQPSPQEFSSPGSFDTRNVGTKLQAEVISDPNGPLLHFELQRVVEGGKSVHHRIFRDGEWKVDMTFPIFTSTSWRSELRLRTGEWMLVGSGSDIDSKGNLDPARSVLAFIQLN